MQAQRRMRGVVDGHLRLAQRRPRPFDALGDELPQLDAFRLQHQLAGTRQRHQVQVADQAIDLLQLAMHQPQLLGFAREDVIQHALHASHRGIERGAQFMRQHRAGVA